MKSEFLTNCCRICLGRGRKLRSLYTPTEEGELPPNEMLQLIAGISLEKVSSIVFKYINIILTKVISTIYCLLIG